MFYWEPKKIRLVGAGFLGKFRCNCATRVEEEVFFGPEERIIGAITNKCSSSDDDEKSNTRTSRPGDGPRFPQLLFMIKLLGTFGSRQDLKNLRQVSQLHYKLLNPIYLDHIGIGLSIGRREGLGVDVNEIWMLGTNTKGERSFNCGIPPWTWNPEFAYIFRKISISQNLLWYDQPKLQYDGIHLNSIISQVRPFITILHIPNLPAHPNLLDFINQFHELKQLNIDFPSYYMTTETEVMDTMMDTLKSLVQNLKKKTVHIKLSVGHHYWQILETFGNISGIAVELYIQSSNWRSSAGIFSSLSDNSGKWRNIKFISLDFYIPVNSISSELMMIISRYAKHQDHIRKCSMVFTEFPPEHNPSEESTIQKCLAKLSPILSNLVLLKVHQWNVFALNSGTIWENLKYLTIFGLEYPLEFLKGSSTSSSFPALFKLIIFNVDQDVCIFHDSQNSHEEALVTYFGNLPKLKYLSIQCKEGTIDRLSTEPELISMLKELRPQLEVQSYHLLEAQMNYKRSIHFY